MTGSDHEGDGGWPFRDVKRERKEIERIRKIVPAEGQQVIPETDADQSQGNPFEQTKGNLSEQHLRVKRV